MIRLGTRGSALARVQTEFVRKALSQAHPGLETSVEMVLTRGDMLLNDPLPLIGGKGLFTNEILVYRWTNMCIMRLVTACCCRAMKPVPKFS